MTAPKKANDADVESAKDVLARQLPEIRSRVGMASAQELADRLAKLGGRLDRAAISKIESKARNVSLDEALLLAVALNVAPVHLFLPREDAAEVKVAAGLPAVPAVQLRAWFRGSEPTFATVKEQTFRSEVPESEWKAARTPSARELEAGRAVESARRRVLIASRVKKMLQTEIDVEPQRADLRNDMRLARAELAEAQIDQEAAEALLQNLHAERESTLGEDED